MKKKTQQPKQPHRSLVPNEKIRRMILLIVNTAFFTFLYFALNYLVYPYLMTLVYLVGGGALAIWYVIYNRGFRTKGKTADMLSDELPLEDRLQMISEDEARFRKTRWVLLILLPFLFAVLIDLLLVFFIPAELLP